MRVSGIPQAMGPRQNTGDRDGLFSILQTSLCAGPLYQEKTTDIQQESSYSHSSINSNHRIEQKNCTPELTPFSPTRLSYHIILQTHLYITEDMLTDSMLPPRKKSAENILKYFSLIYPKIGFDISCKFSF